jgi:hypothetical protein
MKMSNTENVRHSSESNEHYSPKYIVEAAREALGGSIDLDPASCEFANRTVKARRYYNEEANGLIQPWFGKIFLNPPGGKVEGQSNQKIFWRKLMESYLIDNTVTEAIYLSFSIEFLQVAQTELPRQYCPHNYHICFPSKRVPYMKPNGESGDSPPHASMLVYIGENVKRFLESMSDNVIGLCMGPVK